MLLLTKGRTVGLALAVHGAFYLYACSATPAHRTLSEAMADEVLAAQVREALRRDPMLYDAHITVNAERGVVRLSGVLSEADDFYQVRRIANGVPGVTRVVNNLQLVDRR